MLDPQTPVAALGALCAMVLYAALPSTLIEAHTGRRTWLSRGDHPVVPPVPRNSLWIEVPIVVVLIGATQLVMAAIALAPASGLVTRAIAAIEIVTFLIWMTYLIRTIRK
jgi:hypothetical protein